MPGYVKLFGSILESTIWLESPVVRVVWITLLAMADRDGIVEASIPGLAKRAGVDRSECERAMACFQAPDRDSRTKTNDGRRIEVVDGGWRLLNYEAYRDKASAEEAREKAAARQQRWRDRQSLRVTLRNGPSRHIAPVTLNNDIASAPSPPSAPSPVDPDPQTAAPSSGEQPQPTDTQAMVVRPTKAPPTRGQQSGRIYLHRWQIDEMIDTLGPHAAAFALDEWIDGLTALAGDVVLARDQVWPWVKVALMGEIQRRGLPVATVTPAVTAPTNKRHLAGVRGAAAAMGISEAEAERMILDGIGVGR